MKKKFFLLFLLSLFWLNTFAQTVLTLEKCQQLARENYPAIKQYDLVKKAEEYTLSNISKIFLPQISLNGQASYHTAVTKLELKPKLKSLLSLLPQEFNIDNFIETMPQDQYNAYLEATQLIWDGGQSGAGKKVVQASSETEKQKIEVGMYAISDKINQLYFAILTIQEQKKQLDLYYENLQSILNMAQSAYNNGVATQNDLDLVIVEILNLDQKKIELEMAQNACIQVIAIFINQNLAEDTQFTLPEEIAEIPTENNRPEILQFEKQKRLYDVQKQAINAKNMPTLGLFVRGGFGRPGLNMLDPNFQPYAIGGIKFIWNFGNFYTKRNELNLIKNNLNVLDVQEEIFRFNNNLEMSKLETEVEKYQKLMSKDSEIVLLRGQIRKSAQSKYQNGIYQMKDLIADTNAENIAKQTKSMHYIQYLSSLYSLKNLNGN